MNKHKIYSSISLFILYLTTILWLLVYNNVLIDNVNVDDVLIEMDLFKYQDYRYFILIPTLLITTLIAYFYKQKKRLYTISTILITMQIIFMTWFMYKDIFICSCVVD